MPAAADPVCRLLYGLSTAFAVLACSGPAHAYLDPGTGSIILQSILASIAVALGALRVYWQQFKTFFLRRTRSAEEIDRAEPAESSPDSH